MNKDTTIQVVNQIKDVISKVDKRMYKELEQLCDYIQGNRLDINESVKEYRIIDKPTDKNAVEIGYKAYGCKPKNIRAYSIYIKNNNVKISYWLEGLLENIEINLHFWPFLKKTNKNCYSYGEPRFIEKIGEFFSDFDNAYYSYEFNLDKPKNIVMRRKLFNYDSETDKAKKVVSSLNKLTNGLQRIINGKYYLYYESKGR